MRGAEQARKRFMLTFSKLPGQEFGPYLFGDAVRELTIAALLSPLAARNTVLDSVLGPSTAETGESA
jgi:hypothetical protein